jgi:FKBP-type peptidyl-prolyl cis-trans isomerase
MKIHRLLARVLMPGLILSAGMALIGEQPASTDQPKNANKGFDPNLAQASPGVPGGLTATNALTKEQEAYIKQRAERIAKAAEKQREDFELNRKKGAAFLAENAGKQGVRVLPSGLQCKVLSEGHGEKPAVGAAVKVHYKAQSLDGEEFRNSWTTGKPHNLRLTPGVMIKGLLEALLLMREGDHWQLFMPYTLGLGEEGDPLAGIPPGATLIYDIELISITTPQQAAVAATNAMDVKAKEARR